MDIYSEWGRLCTANGATQLTSPNSIKVHEARTCLRNSKQHFSRAKTVVRFPKFLQSGRWSVWKLFCHGEREARYWFLYFHFCRTPISLNHEKDLIWSPATYSFLHRWLWNSESTKNSCQLQDMDLNPFCGAWPRRSTLTTPLWMKSIQAEKGTLISNLSTAFILVFFFCVILWGGGFHFLWSRQCMVRVIKQSDSQLWWLGAEAVRWYWLWW